MALGLVIFPHVYLSQNKCDVVHALKEVIVR